MDVHFYSPPCFEEWDWRNPDKPGIGGSETAHIEMAVRMARRGYKVTSYSPVPADCPDHHFGGVEWKHVRDADFSAPGLWVVSRWPELADNLTRPDQIMWLVCQDEDYAGRWTDARQDRIDRVIALCTPHGNALVEKYPRLARKVCVGSNGLKPELVEQVWGENLIRNPRRIMYASSPDRALIPALQVFSRVREFVPDAEFHVCYGFDNIDKLVGHAEEKQRAAGGDVRAKGFLEYVADLKAKLKQPGVVWHGRMGQADLYREWAKTGVWLYPVSRFRETSPVHGDTLVETLTGPVPIRELAGKQGFKVYSCNAAGHLSVSTVNWVGMTRQNAEVVRLRVRPGVGRNAKKEKTLTLTPDHEVMMRDGTYRPAGTLKPGDRVKAFHKLQNGFGKGYATVGVTDGPLVPAHRFVAEHWNGRPLAPGEVVDHLDGNTRNNEPANLAVRGSQSEHAADHARRMTADERRENSEKKSRGVRRFQERAGADETKRLRAAACRAMWEKVNALPPEERERRMLDRAAKKKAKACSNHVVVAVEPAGTADVYCMEVDPDHNFVANGIFVHNCITSMEAQALGAVPVVSPVWAVGENVHYGVAIDGDYSDPLVIARFATSVVALMEDPGRQDEIRQTMMREARRIFTYERFVDQYEAWLWGYANGSRATEQQHAFHLRWKQGRVLNVGCNDDPGELGKFGVNVDVMRGADQWTGREVRPDVKADARNLPDCLHGNFDTVALSDVLEHFDCDGATAALRQAALCLRPGGRITVTCPEDRRPLPQQHTNGQALEGSTYADGCYAYHWRPVTRSMMEAWFAGAGLAVEFYRPIDYGFAFGHGFSVRPQGGKG